jgi:hypothetical protein
LDYTNSSCPKILLEPQRSNSVTRSEAFDDAAWQKTAAGTGVAPAVTANHAISPDGTQNADLVVFNRGAGNTSSDFSWIYQNFVTSAATYTISCYVKAATSADVGKNVAWRNFGGGDAWDVTLTNEWQRISVQATGGGASQEVGFYNRGGYSSANSVSVLMWGFQAEVGAYATSYIPTTSAAVTRLADAASKTGISSLIGQTEGVIFAEFDISQLGITGGSVDLIGGSDVISLQFPPVAPNNVRGVIYIGGGFPVVMDGAFTTTGTLKAAFAYKNNDFVLYVNGSLASFDSFGSVPTCSQLSMNAPIAGGIKQTLLFKTRLTNAQLAELTTL